VQNVRTELSEQSHPAQPSMTSTTANQQLHPYQHGMSNSQLAPQYSDQTQPMTEHYAATQIDQFATSTDPPPAAIRSSFAVGVCTSLFVSSSLSASGP